jgi:phosphoenolpyruvate carboxykinase (ATP)
MKLSYTRKLIDGIHEGVLDNAEFETTPIFNLQIPKNVPGVPKEILNPKNTWR